jgi:hypothetical protein
MGKARLTTHHYHVLHEGTPHAFHPRDLQEQGTELQDADQYKYMRGITSKGFDH